MSVPVSYEFPLVVWCADGAVGEGIMRRSFVGIYRSKIRTRKLKFPVTTELTEIEIPLISAGL